MIDYDKLIEWLDQEIADKTASIIYWSSKETDFAHGKRIGVIMGNQEIRDMIEELRMKAND